MKNACQSIGTGGAAGSHEAASACGQTARRINWLEEQENWRRLRKGMRQEPVVTGDAFALFDGYLDANGMYDFDGPLTYNFTGLDPTETYDIVLYSARGPYSANPPREVKFIIFDVDAFTNISSTGTTITTTTVSNDSTIVNIRASMENGYVARFTGIAAGADGDMQIDIDNQSDWNETNALRLIIQSPANSSYPRNRYRQPIIGSGRL